MKKREGYVLFTSRWVGIHTLWKYDWIFIGTEWVGRKVFIDFIQFDMWVGRYLIRWTNRVMKNPFMGFFDFWFWC